MIIGSGARRRELNRLPHRAQAPLPALAVPRRARPAVMIEDRQFVRPPPRAESFFVRAASYDPGYHRRGFDRDPLHGPRGPNHHDLGAPRAQLGPFGGLFFARESQFARRRAPNPMIILG